MTNKNTKTNTWKLTHVKNFQVHNFYDLESNNENPTHNWIDRWARPHNFSPIVSTVIVLENIKTGELFLLSGIETAKHYVGFHLTQKKYNKLIELYETDEDKFWDTINFITFDF